MQVNFSTNTNRSEQSFTAIRADRTGRALLVQRMKQVRNEADAWEELVKIIEKHKNDPNDIFITGGNGDGGIGIVIENKISGAKKSIAEGPLKIDTPIDFIKKAVAIGDEFTKKMRKPLGIKQRIQEILDMM